MIKVELLEEDVNANQEEVIKEICLCKPNF